MQETNKTRDMLVGEFSENYVEKLFYFCLKKTGSHIEAEDLTQDIALQIITALNKGTIPTSFSAWVWQIARNRYSLWAKEKHNRNESLTGDHIGDYEIEDESKGILDEMIHTEQMALLRRELAFIKSDYRNIVVAYYIENKSVRDIASSLSVSISAVQQRLHRARIILKEGMNMAREFGIRSYKPEEITFTNSCDNFGDYGQPWSILYHALYKNIFLEAYGNPSTAEELAIELGVALPYMEDELKYLTEQTFLIKKENKYETAFPIIGKDVQEKIWNYNSRITERLTELFEKLVDDYSKACETHGIKYYGEYTTYEDAKWVLLMRAFDALAYAKYKGKFEYTKRPDNGSWDIVGYQNADTPYIPWVGQHGSDASFSQYKFKYENIEAKTPSFLSSEEAHALAMVAKGKGEICEQIWLDKLLGYGYIKKNNSAYEPAIVVFNADTAEKSWMSFTDEERNSITQNVEEIKRIVSAAKEFAFNLTAESLPPLFKNNERMCYFACSNSTMSRDIVFMQAIKDGWIKNNEHTSKVVGAYIYI
ncbi:MAG: sigma-70 family RNA polymerase sigma factor [Ruminococcaceae bacterium]|nr:sigma-70 family RNA polymerase sigma factor [Oscillospiraceae bacterium]